MGRRPISSGSYELTPMRARRPSQTVIGSCKRLFYVKECLLTHHVIARPRQFVGRGFDRHDPIGLGLLALIKSPDPFVMSDGEVGRFNERPREVFVATLAVAFTFFLAIADAFGFNASTIRRKIAHPRKAPDIPCFQHNRQGKNVSMPGTVSNA